MTKVMCARSMTAAVNTLSANFVRDAGKPAPEIVFGTVGALQAKIAAGETADVLVLGAPTIATMERACTLLAGTGRAIARTSIGVAVRQGAPAPDLSTAEAFTQALRAARSIAFSDAAVGGSAGVHLAALWGRIGMAEEIARKGMPQKSGAEVAARVAEGAADLGLTLIAEILTVPGVRVAGKLPPPFGNDTTYAAGISAGAVDRAAAEAFIDALVHPSARAVWAAAGFEPPQ